MGKDPWLKFWPGDWLTDIKLQSCTLAARGLLINLMCVMHQSEQYGYFLVNGQKCSRAAAGRLLSCDERAARRLTKELLNKGVLIEEDGVLVCPRMVRDWELSGRKSRAGKQGGNPILLKQEDNQVDNKVLKPRSQKLDKDKRLAGSVKKPDPRIPKIFEFWDAQYQARYGRKYAFTGKKEGELIKKTLTTLEPRALCERIKIFFATDDEWIIKTGHTIGIFHSTLNRALHVPRSARPREPDPDLDERRCLAREREDNPDEFQMEPGMLTDLVKNIGTDKPKED